MVACVPKNDKRANPSAGFTPFGESQCCGWPALKGVRATMCTSPGAVTRPLVDYAVACRKSTEM
jgi:hypothetical protein